jgi:hypothetical protein
MLVSLRLVALLERKKVLIKEIVAFLHTEPDLGSFLLCEQDAVTRNFS